METGTTEAVDPFDQFKHAFNANGVPRVAELLDRHRELRGRINDPCFAFDAPAILCTREPGKREMIDVLLRYGADINARSQWWAGGFGILDWVDNELGDYLISRGANVDAHAAAHLGKLDRLRELLTADPSLVHAPGGDGKTPLHCAGTIEVAKFLLDHGANIDALDVDHESTPAQYMLDHRLDIARLLIERGCRTDLLMAAAVGDLELATKHLDSDPACININITPTHFPMRNSRAGGSIYIWTLGSTKTPHQIAHQRGHKEIVDLLMERSPAEIKLAQACLMHNEELARKVVENNPGLINRLSDESKGKLADAAQSGDMESVRLMLSFGLPADGHGPHGGTALHWSAWHGLAEMVDLILAHHPPLNDTNNEFSATPLGWAIHGSENGWRRNAGNYPATVERLCTAGAKLPEEIGGTPEVRDILRKFGLAG
ncbi:MAG TPA: ankyrin repeat domain-containing protein, partial [Tepidisphaeraceae bacterium]|nr:ankyrin repeat domain-containing protein [Tepidisphaeraceae bacterium]